MHVDVKRKIHEEAIHILEFKNPYYCHFNLCLSISFPPKHTSTIFQTYSCIKLINSNTW